jgi:hypothetical protein
MLASDILSDARYTLSDTAKTRWTDARLLALLNDALIDCAKNTSIFVENIFYVVQDLVVDIDMSDYILKTLRVEYLDEPIPFYSFEEMDAKYGSLWQHDTGSKVLAIVYDKQRNGIFKQYPIVENAQNQYIEYNSLYGITTDISYSDILPIVGGSYGDLAPIPPEALLKFYYVRRHAKLTAIADTLYIDDLLRTPLAKYVTGMALRDNQDAQNRAMGNEELKFYYAMVEEYSIQKSEVYVRAQHEVRYRPND